MVVLGDTESAFEDVLLGHWRGRTTWALRTGTMSITHTDTIPERRTILSIYPMCVMLNVRPDQRNVSAQSIKRSPASSLRKGAARNGFDVTQARCSFQHPQVDMPAE